MSKITIYGYASFNEWVEAGCPGAVSFNPDGTIKDKTTRRSKCLLYDGSMVANGLCLVHDKAFRDALVRSA